MMYTECPVYLDLGYADIPDEEFWGVHHEGFCDKLRRLGFLVECRNDGPTGWPDPMSSPKCPYGRPNFRITKSDCIVYIAVFLAGVTATYWGPQAVEVSESGIKPGPERESALCLKRERKSQQ